MISSGIDAWPVDLIVNDFGEAGRIDRPEFPAVGTIVCRKKEFTIDVCQESGANTTTSRSDTPSGH
jgi:hypothetical protein